MTPDPGNRRTAIVDIGSNSIRLVVYEGPARLPAVLFNEKVLAGLGRSLATSGRIDDNAMALAGAALSRFAALTREMDCDAIRTVATAAVRDAENGDALIALASDLGLRVEILSGEQEARAAGAGVLSAIPDADGIVGDLGGGSLELVRIAHGEVRDSASFPLGVLRIGALVRDAPTVLAERVAAAVDALDWVGEGRDRPFYLVGGSWRALARVDMAQSGFPLPIIQNYHVATDTVARFARELPQMTKAQLRDVPGLSSGRIPTLADAASLLSLLLERIGSSGAIVSAFGLREGLLFDDLDAATRAQDPLLVAVADEGRRTGRFPAHGDLLDRWIAPLFADDVPAAARLRLAACRLADVGWRAHPEYRAERGVEIALHGSWVGVDAAGRAQMAQALHASMGGGATIPPPLSLLAHETLLARASAWGLAIRLGQRLSAGLAGPLRRSRLARDGDDVVLELTAQDRALYGPAVVRRHGTLANALGARPVMRDA